MPATEASTVSAGLTEFRQQIRDGCCVGVQKHHDWDQTPWLHANIMDARLLLCQDLLFACCKNSSSSCSLLLLSWEATCCLRSCKSCIAVSSSCKPMLLPAHKILLYMLQQSSLDVGLAASYLLNELFVVWLWPASNAQRSSTSSSTNSSISRISCMIESSRSNERACCGSS